ncbi:MAG: polysaccharide deacetylase family protein [Flavobacteriales bacterium]|nr:polysaccharide deacetylase family protein [Flavobacteriales bacterium]
MYLIRPPRVYRWLFKEAVFRKDPDKKVVYLTFDDGPHPEATELVLRVLQEHEVKATFFMLGKNVEKYPTVVEQVRQQGHIIGNHGMDHLNGWVTDTNSYTADYLEGKRLIGTDLFRPAYGKLTLSQYNILKKDNIIVFWDVISGDFDTTIGEKTVTDNVLRNVRNGSIIVMHDSQKAMKNLKGSLNGIIEELKKKGFEFGAL